MATASLSGCAWNNASLATDSAPTLAGGRWSTQPAQYVHVGEPVNFSLVVLHGPGDYAEVFFDGAAKPITLAADGEGHFTFQQTFMRTTPPGQPLTVRAVAYLIRGRQDRMFIDGEPVCRDPRTDPPDRKCGQARLKLHVYQSRVRFELPPLRQPYDFTTARLIIRRADGTSTVVRQADAQTRGFRLLGPDQAGRYVITYQPLASQVNRTGTTEVELFVRDAQGRVHTSRQIVPTP